MLASFGNSSYCADRRSRSQALRAHQLQGAVVHCNHVVPWNCLAADESFRHSISTLSISRMFMSMGPVALHSKKKKNRGRDVDDVMCRQTQQLASGWQ